MKWSTVYVEPTHDSIVKRALTVSVPREDVAGPVERHQLVRMHIFDAHNRDGHAQECLAFVADVLPGWVRVRPAWHTLGPEPDWDTSRRHDGSRKHLTFGWRWQYHPARTISLPWWKWVWNGGTDEFHNRAFWFRLPWASIAVFYKRPYRTRRDGRREECRNQQA